jgi:hypothetical protein
LLAASVVQAAQYPPGYRWRTITTGHFLIHFHQGEEVLAQRAAVIAEKAHVRVTSLLGAGPTQRRTHLILTDHVDISNGSANPFPNNRMEIYVTAPGADPSSAIGFYDDWLNLVITHEYAHIVHLDQVHGFWRAVRRVFGRDILTFPHLFEPPWVIEGLATWVESEETNAGRLNGTYVDMVLRTAAEEGRWLSPTRAEGYSPAWPDGGARYFYGSKFLDHLAKRYGKEKIGAFIDDYAGNVIPYQLNASAEAVFGKEMIDLWEEWSREQQQSYRADVEKLRAQGLTERRQLTKLGFGTRFPIVSPDGARIAYAHEGEYEWPTLRVWDVARGADVATATVNDTSALSWSPDGTTIAFSQLEFRRAMLNSDVWLWKIGSDPRQLTRGARLKDPAFTPDGRTLIAVQKGAGRNRIVEVDVATGAVKPLVIPDGDIQFSEPSVSHDGSRIAVAEWHGGQVDVVVYDRSGTRIADLTESLASAINGSPRFSRDDATMYFSSDATGVTNVYSVPSRGGAVGRLTNVYGGALYPSSADGRRFYISDYSADGWNLASFDAGEALPVVPRQSAKQLVAEIPATPAAALPDAPYSPWRSALPQSWFPLIGTANDDDGGDSGIALGFTTSGADVLGFHSYAVSVLGDDYSLLYNYDRLYPTLTLFAAQYDNPVNDVRVRRADGSVGEYQERTRRLLLQATQPVLRFRKGFTGSLGLIRDEISNDRSFDLSDSDLAASGIFTGTLQGVRAAAVFSSAAQFGYSVSPENGVTAMLGFEALSGDASVRNMRLDTRAYLGIPYRRDPLGRHALAMRVAAGQRRGDFVLQRDMKVGGEGFGELASVDLTELPVRGYSTARLRGDSALIGSLEYRFPIWQIDRGPGVYPIFFQRLIGDVFVDFGTAWNTRAVSLPLITRRKTDPFDDTITSAGAEVSLDFVAGHLVPLRYRVGIAVPFDDDGVKFYTAIGMSF